MQLSGRTLEVKLLRRKEGILKLEERGEMSGVDKSALEMPCYFAEGRRITQ
jgi:hypothetical protein